MRAARSRPDPKPCVCGGVYDRLRTEMSYREVRRGMDPERWKGRRRAAVLGRWRELKLMMWDAAHQQCADQQDQEEQPVKRYAERGG